MSMSKHNQNYRFNPSQVQFTPTISSFKINFLSRFNPSQVQFTRGQVEISLTDLPFQSLTGSIHTLDADRGWVRLQGFQSLTGSIHTLIGINTLLCHNRVSIPHRFNSHKNDKFLVLYKIICFNPSQVQFTLEIMAKASEILIEFQSLTGSIHTSDDVDKVNTLLEFQSLTGSIHTKYPTIYPTNTPVSIPHRFNSHT